MNENLYFRMLDGERVRIATLVFRPIEKLKSLLEEKGITDLPDGAVEGLVIGRTPSKCDIVVTAGTASRVHVFVVSTGEQLFVHDAGGLHAAQLNDENLPRSGWEQISVDDRLGLGTSTLTLIDEVQQAELRPNGIVLYPSGKSLLCVIGDADFPVRIDGEITTIATNPLRDGQVLQIGEFRLRIEVVVPPSETETRMTGQEELE